MEAGSKNISQIIYFKGFGGATTDSPFSQNYQNNLPDQEIIPGLQKQFPVICTSLCFHATPRAGIRHQHSSRLQPGFQLFYSSKTGLGFRHYRSKSADSLQLI